MKLIAGNWKMYKGPAEAAEFCLGLRDEDLDGADVVVCPPYVSLAVSVQLLAGTEVAVAAAPEASLPMTGSDDDTLVRMAVMLIIAGAVTALAGARRRKQRNQQIPSPGRHPKGRQHAHPLTSSGSTPCCSEYRCEHGR